MFSRTTTAKGNYALEEILYRLQQELQLLNSTLRDPTRTRDFYFPGDMTYDFQVLQLGQKHGSPVPITLAPGATQLVANESDLLFDEGYIWSLTMGAGMSSAGYSITFKGITQINTFTATFASIFDGYSGAAVPGSPAITRFNDYQTPAFVMNIAPSFLFPFKASNFSVSAINPTPASAASIYSLTVVLLGLKKSSNR